MNKIEIYDVLKTAQLHITNSDKCRDDLKHILHNVSVITQYEIDENSLKFRISDAIRNLRCTKEESEKAEIIYIEFLNSLNGEKEAVNV